MTNTTNGSQDMRSDLRTAALGCMVVLICFFVPASSAGAQTLRADYQFDDTLTSSVGPAPALTQAGICATPSYATDTVNGAPDRVLAFEAGCGLQLDSSVLTSPGSYSIVLLFHFNALGYFRILDLNSQEPTLYYYFGHLYLNPPDSFGPTEVTADQYAQVVMTRDATTKDVVGYINGKEQWRFTDSDDAVLLSAPSFFSTDTGGVISRLRVYDGPLAPAEVGMLEGTPPVGIVVTKAGTGQGTVQSSPAGIDCRSDCSETYAFGTQVTLTADPATDPARESTFSGFEGGGCSGSATTCTVTVDEVQKVTAKFTRVQHPVTVATAGSGQGTVTSSPARIDCGLFCSQSFDSFTSVTLTADPGAGSSFAGFSGGGCTGASRRCTVFLDVARSVAATFTRDQRTLTVTKAGTGEGRVTTIPGGIDCGADCSKQYGSGTQVLLVADPATGSSFAGFSGGGCAGTATTCYVTLDQARSVTATFTLAGGPLAGPSASAAVPTATAAPTSTADRPPVLSGLGMFPARFRVGPSLPRLARPSQGGPTIRFRLSEPATIRLSFAVRRSGRRVGDRCLRGTPARRHQPQCTRFVALSRSVTLRGARTGLNVVRFQGRLSRTRTLRPGHYRLTVVAIDAQGSRSRSKRTLLSVRREATGSTTARAGSL